MNPALPAAWRARGLLRGMAIAVALLLALGVVVHGAMLATGHMSLRGASPLHWLQNALVLVVLGGTLSLLDGSRRAAITTLHASALLAAVRLAIPLWRGGGGGGLDLRAVTGAATYAVFAYLLYDALYRRDA